MKAVKITFRGVIGGENSKILKIFIFWFFDFLDRFYTFTLGLDLFTARGSGHRSRSTHFIFRFKVATILSDFPLLKTSREREKIGKVEIEPEGVIWALRSRCAHSERLNPAIIGGG